jgi:deoxyribonuclease-4
MRKMIGAHINREKTLKKTIEKLYSYGGNALQIFTSNPKSLSAANVDKYTLEYETIKDLKCGFVIHSSYIINIATLDPKQIEINSKIIIADLLIANKFKAVGVIIHVGKYVENQPSDCMKQMKAFMLYIMDFIKTNELTGTKIILETGAGQGTEMLVNIDELIDFVKDFDSNYFSLCFDTCHVWSAGVDIIEAYNKIQKETNGMITVVHFNGSKTPFGSLKDRHDALFASTNTIPIDVLKKFLSNLKKVMIILETPIESEYKKEIEFLRKGV